ncbi:MAG: GSU2403 family nucleotidyltransferase fold protein [Longimicrobiaceae bacterium]
MDDLAAFARLIEALRPWLAHVVIVGGWAHRLHRHHPLANPPSFLPLATRDADVAFSPNEPMQGDIAVALAAAGFKEERTGEHMPPVSRYRLGDGAGGFYAEFLAPLSGSAVKRHGKLDATALKAGVTAQKLRHVGLLLEKPFAVTVGSAVGFAIEPAAEVLLPNPVSYIVQKLLIQQERSPGKRPHDVLYVHDTLMLFASHLDDLREIWREDVRPSLPPRTAMRVERLVRERFREVDDVIRTAARIQPDRALRPERVLAACAAGLGEIFGN